MIKTGQQHLEGLRDGRVVYIGDERVNDVTTHPAFARAAQTVAGLYDMSTTHAIRTRSRSRKWRALLSMVPSGEEPR